MTNQNKKSEFLKIAFESRPILTAYAYSVLKDWSLAQDVFQDAVISMNEKVEDIKADSPIKWLKSVMRNKSIDIIRKNERNRSRNEQISILIDKRFDQFLNQENINKCKAQEKALNHCMEKLPVASRKVILDFYKSRLSCDKIAEICRRSTNAVRLILSRSRADLRYCVKNELEQE
ncbi:MAG: sigma-70 family RNA polymerase sigma factor [Lentisphaeraceae bacterium]|nr:sigma-70 family RNA polymerase sigma factor [Lentisphaeraceae bacterium]